MWDSSRRIGGCVSGDADSFDNPEQQRAVCPQPLPSAWVSASRRRGQADLTEGARQQSFWGWVSRGLPLPCGRRGCPSGPPGRGGRIGIRCAGRGGPAVASGSSTGRPAGWPRCVHRWWPQVPALLSPGGIRSRFSVPPAAHHCCTLREVPQPTGKAVSRPASAPTSFRPVNSRSTSAAIHPTACGRTRHRRPGTDLADHAPIPRPPAGDWGRTRRR